MTIPKDLIEQVEKELNDPRTGLKASSDTNKAYYRILAIVEDAYRRGAEDMGKQAMEILVSEKEELLLYYHPDANGTRIEKSFNEALRLIQERKDNFLK